MHAAAAFVALATISSTAIASDAGGAPRPVFADASVEWLVPAAAPVQPQTPEAVEHGRQFGRKLPAPEPLQPTLDAALPAYKLRSGVSGTFKGASSDVLPGLVNAWIEAFKSRKPVVTCPDSGEPAHFVQNGVNGLVVPPTAEDLAQALECLIVNPRRAAEMGEQGFRSVAHIRWDSIASTLVQSVNGAGVTAAARRRSSRVPTSSRRGMSSIPTPTS